MLDGQGKAGNLFHPQGLFGGLAFGAVTVATAIVAVALLLAVLTYFLVSAHSCGAALHDIVQCFYLYWVKALFFHKPLAKAVYHRGQLVPNAWGGHTGYPADCEV